MKLKILRNKGFLGCNLLWKVLVLMGVCMIRPSMANAEQSVDISVGELADISQPKSDGSEGKWVENKPYDTARITQKVGGTDVIIGFKISGSTGNAVYSIDGEDNQGIWILSGGTGSGGNQTITITCNKKQINTIIGNGNLEFAKVTDNAFEYYNNTEEEKQLKTFTITFKGEEPDPEPTPSYGDTTITIGEAGYATFYSDKSYTIAEGAEVFIIKDDATTTKDNNVKSFTLVSQGKNVPQKTGVVIKAKEGKYKLTAKEVSATEISILNGTTTEQSKKSGMKYYVLGKENGMIGFYEYVGEKLPAKKAYYEEVE